MVERALGEAGGDRGDAEPAGVEAGERDAQPVALLAEPPLDGDADVVEAHRRGGRAGEPHLALGRVGAEAGGVGGDQEAGDARCGSSQVRAITL